MSEYMMMSFGSSPLTRGARVGDSEGLTRERLIPAHAGSTVPII